MGVGGAMVSTDWVVLLSLWEAPTHVLEYDWFETIGSEGVK
jgi:hypothetical protein